MQFALMNSAPEVDVDLNHAVSRYIAPDTKELVHNPTVEEMWRPVAGPFRPGRKVVKTAQSQGIQQNAVTGWSEKIHMDQFAFEEQYQTFQNYGFAANPSVNANDVIGDSKAFEQKRGEGVSGTWKQKKTEEQKVKRKLRKKATGDIMDHDSFRGPWASYYYEEEEVKQEPNEEQLAHREMQAKKKQKTERKEREVVEESTIFHGSELKDALGRSYMHPPTNVPSTAPEKYYGPKKCIHVWSGHSKGVNAIQFFPKTAHLLLSCSMDNTIKIWDVMSTRHCMRTYLGHEEAVRQIDFTPSGERFISVSYDRWVKNWDTETGQCISRHTTHKVPYCVKVCPIEGRDHQILVGQSNKRIVQWDVRSNSIVQNYDEHLGAVNTVTFIDGNRKFVTTSDDKKVYVWEYGIPVVMKHISEPEMHSMPSVALAPNGKFWIGQSQNNQIHVYGAQRKFGLNRKKRFMGHLTSGYACQVNWSPDGRMVMSGDAQGRLFIWDWRTCKVWKRLKCHKQVTMGCIWHPLFSSRVATCSWDGTIKYWD